MLELFLKKQKGAITIMLSFLLIAVLSINTTFIETARYKGLESLYKEIEDSAAFSVLSQYDRELFKNYGLMAISEDKGKDSFIKYVNADLNKELSGAGRIRNMLDLLDEDVSFEKIYDLSQSEVFKEQINEFCAYRAPMTLVNNGLNIEETLKGLIKEVESSLPALRMFRDLTKSIKQVLDIFIKLGEYQESSKVLREMTDEYENNVNEYNAAIEARESFISNHETDEDGYDSSLEMLNSTVKTQAVSLQNAIKSEQSALGTFYEKRVAFMDGYKSMQDANIKSVIQAGRADARSIADEKEREQMGKWLDSFEKAYDSSDEDFAKLSANMNRWTETDIRDSVDRLEVQWEELNNSGDLLQATDIKQLAKQSLIWDTIQFIQVTVETIEAILEGWGETIAAVSDILEVVEILSTGGTYDIKFNNVIDNSFYNSLSGVINGNDQLKLAQNPYEDSDAALVTRQMMAAEEIGRSTGFDTNMIPPASGQQENYILQQAMQNMSVATQHVMKAIINMDSSLGFTLISKVIALINIISALIEFLDSVIHLAITFAQVEDQNLLQTILYQKLYPAVYGIEMFSNRITDVGSSKRMNGSSFPDFADFSMNNTYFDQANAEYILVGEKSEVSNQIYAFQMMMALRILCNLPAILTDETLMEIVGTLTATVIGIIVAVILVVAMLAMEAYTDMIFMLYADDTVKVIKMTGYYNLSGKGIDEAVEKARSIVKNVAGESKKKKQGDDESKVQKYKEGLLEWTYKDHLFLLMLLFVSGDTMYARSANLIEMQMRHKYSIKGKDFTLDDMATYIRVESKPSFTPLLPVPTIPGINEGKIYINNLHYSGY